jgi:3-methylcrotonyl-CoA carboxylase beta subunit
MHAEISGTVDFKEPNDHLCIARLRSLVEKMGERPAPPKSADFQLASIRCRAMRPNLPPRICTAARSRARREQCLRHARSDRPHRRSQRVRRVQSRLRPHRSLRLCAHRRPRRRHRRQPEDQPESDRRHGPGAGAKASKFGGVIYTESAQKGRALHHGLQSEPGPADLSARRQRLHGRQGCGVVGHHPRRRKDGVGRQHQRGAQDHRHRRRQLRRRALRHVRQGLRSALPLRLAHGALCGHERSFAANTLAEVRAKQMERGGKVLSDAEKQALTTRSRPPTMRRPIRATARRGSGSTPSSIRQKPEMC